jgi:hypothetical protein
MFSDSNGGGGDPNVVVAWDVALGLLDAFSGLLDYDLMSEFFLHPQWVALTCP